MKRSNDTLVVEKNRRRGFWALTVVGFMSLVSLVLLGTGLLSSRGILWMPIWLGTAGLLGFGVSTALVVRVMRAPWHLAVDPANLTLLTPGYRLTVPWDNVTGIAVDAASFRLGCVLIFEDPAAVAKGAQFLVRSKSRNVVADAETMLTRMQDSHAKMGYHLGIPGRILEKGPEELAEFLAQARTGQLWAQEGVR